MKQTENYKLSQWDKEDRIMREDFNGDHLKVEEALSAQKDELVALTAAMALKGNCQMETFTYTGTGAYGSDTPTQITFTKMPDVFFIIGDKALMMGRSGEGAPLLICDDASYSGSIVSTGKAKWNGSQLSLTNSVHARYQMNTKDTVYWILVLNRADQ